jgi:hypothetical protein
MTKLEEHAYDFYQYLYDSSFIAKDDGQRYFQGSLTEAFYETGISRSKYSAIRRKLLDQGCVEIKTVGSRYGGPSVVLLRFAPEVDVTLTTGLEDATVRQRSGVQKKQNRLEQRVKGLEAATGGMDIVTALRGFDARLKQIEKRLGIKPDFQ